MYIHTYTHIHAYLISNAVNRWNIATVSGNEDNLLNPKLRFEILVSSNALYE